MIDMSCSLQQSFSRLRWTRITALALAISAAPSLALWNESTVDHEYHALYMLLLRTRAKAMQDGPITVRFTGHRAVVEDRQGGIIEYLWLTTLDEVRYRTIQGDRRIIFGQGGPTTPYNTHLHGGDVTLRSWTGRSRSLWVHCTGGVTGGRNDDWTLNPR